MPQLVHMSCHVDRYAPIAHLLHERFLKIFWWCMTHHKFPVSFGLL